MISRDGNFKKLVNYLFNMFYRQTQLYREDGRLEHLIVIGLWVNKHFDELARLVGFKPDEVKK